MELYGRATGKGNKMMSYSKYDMDLFKHLIHNYCKQLNLDILDNEDEYMIQSVVSTIDDNIGKNNHKVQEIVAYTSHQCHESMRGRDIQHMNYTNNDRIHMFELSTSVLTQETFYIPGLGVGKVVALDNKRLVKQMKCKLGWIKSTNRDKVGF